MTVTESHNQRNGQPELPRSGQSPLGDWVAEFSDAFPQTWVQPGEGEGTTEAVSLEDFDGLDSLAGLTSAVEPSQPARAGSGDGGTDEAAAAAPSPAVGPAENSAETSAGKPTARSREAMTTIAGGWSMIQRHSRLLVAVVNLATHTIEATSDRFRYLVGIGPEIQDLTQPFPCRLSLKAQGALRERVRRHLLKALLVAEYGRDDLLPPRWLYEPLMVSISATDGDRARYVELNVSSDPITLEAFSSPRLETLRAAWPVPPSPQDVLLQLQDPHSPLCQLQKHLTPDRYRATGTILIEGMDITDRELTQQLVQLLLQRQSILEPQRFQEANTLLKSLFRAEDTLILTAEEAIAKVFVDLDQSEWTVLTYPVSALEASPLLQSAGAGVVLPIADLSLELASPCEQLLYRRGARSLLVLPLVLQSSRLQGAAQLVGLVVMASRQINAFDSRDVAYGEALTSPLTVAMRQTVHERFSNIHESVRWRFEEEAERRSLGLTPEPIVFEDVYPLYGISDIRGSSQERNRAIQADLIAQFELAIALLNTIPPAHSTSFLEQFRLDLQERIETLRDDITVDAEVTLLRYLQENLESHLDYFQQCSPETAAAVERYRAAQDPEHQSIYEARAQYDQTVQAINQQLRETWQWWQRSMQQITRHYCDVEATDGIDHMIYAGQSIDDGFTALHLRSLRYEQLRAMCDCARTAFAIKNHHTTPMEITHLVLVQDATVDISHDETTERLFDVRGTRDTRYEIVKKRIDKALDTHSQRRITQPGCLTLVYSTTEEWQEYQEYLRYLHREGWVEATIEQGTVEPLQGVTGLKFARVRILPAPPMAPMGATPSPSISPQESP